MNINIEQEDFGALCICALRYCHGRRTYMPSLVQEIIGKHLSELSDKDIKVMFNDCKLMNADDYGDECDKVDWLKWEQKVKTEYEKRKAYLYTIK